MLNGASALRADVAHVQRAGVVDMRPLGRDEERLYHYRHVGKHEHGKVKAYSSFFAVVQWMLRHSVAVVMLPMTKSVR